MIKLFSSLLLVLLVLASCNENDFGQNIIDSEYPARYCKISESKRAELKDRFESDNILKMNVDSFGFFVSDWSKDISPSLFEGRLNKNSAVDLAKEFVVKYSELTGVKRSSDMVVYSADGFWLSYGGKFVKQNEDDKNQWIVKFKEQKVGDYKVFNTNLRVFVCPKGVYMMYGNWFPKIYIPQVEQVPFSDARKTLIGKTFGYSDWTGPKEWTISTDDFYNDDEPSKMIIPYRNGNCIELRVCWLIHSKTIWNFYVDIITGELIYREQTVIF